MSKPCCISWGCVPDYASELSELQKTANDTRRYLEEIEERILDLEVRIQKGIVDLSLKLEQPVETTTASEKSWACDVASVVARTGTSIVTQQPALAPWHSILRLFQKKT